MFYYGYTSNWHTFLALIAQFNYVMENERFEFQTICSLKGTPPSNFILIECTAHIYLLILNVPNTSAHHWSDCCGGCHVYRASNAWPTRIRLRTAVNRMKYSWQKRRPYAMYKYPIQRIHTQQSQNLCTASCAGGASTDFKRCRMSSTIEFVIEKKERKQTTKIPC